MIRCRIQLGDRIEAILVCKGCLSESDLYLLPWREGKELRDLPACGKCAPKFHEMLHFTGQCALCE